MNLGAFEELNQDELMETAGGMGVIGWLVVIGVCLLLTGDTRREE